MISTLDDSELKSMIELFYRYECVEYSTTTRGATPNYFVDIPKCSVYPDPKLIIGACMRKVALREIDHFNRPPLSLSSVNRGKVAIVPVRYGVSGISAGLLELKVHFVHGMECEEDFKDRHFMEDFKFVVIDGFVSTGRHVIDTINIIGCSRVTDVIVMVDGLAGGMRNITNAFPHVKLHTMLNINQVLEWGVENNQFG